MYKSKYMKNNLRMKQRPFPIHACFLLKVNFSPKKKSKPSNSDIKHHSPLHHHWNSSVISKQCHVFCYQTGSRSLWSLSIILFSEPFIKHIFHPQGLHFETQFIILGSQQHSALWIQKLLTVHFHCSVFAFLGSNPAESWQADDSASAPSAKDTGKRFLLAEDNHQTKLHHDSFRTDRYIWVET